MDRYAARVTASVLTLILPIGCATQPPQQHKSISSSDLQLQHPSSAQALLYNMRAVLERGDLKRREFFTEELLRATFGGSTVSWYQNSPTKVHCLLGGLDYLLQRSTQTRSSTMGLIWSEARSKIPGEPYFANFSIQCECHLTSEDIEALFGNVDRTVEPLPFRGAHYPAPPRATHPLGNQIARYVIDGPEGYVTSFEVHYDYAGYVNVMAGRLDSDAVIVEIESRKLGVRSP